ncbi:MAG: M28 family metallopeptidase [Chitinophagaceae bacterium]
MISITAKSQPENIADAIFHEDSIKSIVSFLSHDSLKGRLTGSPENLVAANFIASQFKQAGVLPMSGMQDYFSEFTFFTNSTKEIKGINVIGTIPGMSKKKELIIFCAHYDHIGTTNSKPSEKTLTPGIKEIIDTIYNGANDNATGTAAVLLLSRYFSNLKNNERTILFIAFSGEEFGLKGSYAFNSIINSSSIKAVINIEMIGRGINSKRDHPFITGIEYSDLGYLLNKKLKNKVLDSNGRKILFTKDPNINENLFSRSDNYPFALGGIAAHTIMATSPKDPFYHSVNDEIETIDFKNMSLVIKAIALGCTGLIDGTDTPQRINPSKLINN